MKSTKRSAKTQKGTLLLIALVALVALAGVLEAKRKVVENQLEQVLSKCKLDLHVKIEKRQLEL